MQLSIKLLLNKKYKENKKKKRIGKNNTFNELFNVEKKRFEGRKKNEKKQKIGSRENCLQIHN